MHLVLHVGIAGFSRLMFLRVANNNRSRAVFDGFLEGVRKFGVPSRYRYKFLQNYPIIEVSTIGFSGLILVERMFSGPVHANASWVEPR